MFHQATVQKSQTIALTVEIVSSLWLKEQYRESVQKVSCRDLCLEFLIESVLWALLSNHLIIIIQTKSFIVKGIIDLSVTSQTIAKEWCADVLIIFKLRYIFANTRTEMHYMHQKYPHRNRYGRSSPGINRSSYGQCWNILWKHLILWYNFLAFIGIRVQDFNSFRVYLRIRRKCAVKIHGVLLTASKPEVLRLQQIFLCSPTVPALVVCTSSLRL